MNYSLGNEVEGVKAVWGGGFSIYHYYTLHSGVVLAKQTSLVGKVATE